jgi:hypothetical protein
MLYTAADGRDVEISTGNPDRVPFVLVLTADRPSEELRMVVEAQLGYPVRLACMDAASMSKPDGLPEIPRADFPVLLEPDYRFDGRGGYWRGRPSLGDVLCDALSKPAAVFVVTDTADRRTTTLDHYMCGSVLSRAALGDIPLFALDGDGRLQPTTPEGLMSCARGLFRLSYSYGVNFERLVQARFSTTARPNSLGGGVSDEMPEGLAHPLTLQVLFALARRGTVDTRASLGLYRGEEVEKDVPSLYSLYVRNEAEEWCWGGSGAYAPYPVDYVAGLEFALFDAGLVELDAEAETVSITQEGRDFLAAFPPECEDPDVILRWADKTTGLIHERHAEACDLWVAAFFHAYIGASNG